MQEELTLRIGGMSCGHCVARVQKALAGLEGVSVDSVTVGEAKVRFDPAQRARGDLEQAVAQAGFSVVQ